MLKPSIRFRSFYQHITKAKCDRFCFDSLRSSLHSQFRPHKHSASVANSFHFPLQLGSAKTTSNQCSFYRTRSRQCFPLSVRSFSYTANMADDASYTTFLNRANEDVGTSGSKPHDVPSTSQSQSQFDPTSSSTSGGIPKPLTEISATYVSDTDSDFEPVFFSYAAEHLPSVKEFKQCLGTKGQHNTVEELSVEDFDRNGQYKQVIEKVEQAGKDASRKEKGVKVFRVEIDKTRVEYYIVTVGERKLVGVMAKAVES